jgi:hypothetical protein
LGKRFEKKRKENRENLFPNPSDETDKVEVLVFFVENPEEHFGRLTILFLGQRFVAADAMSLQKICFVIVAVEVSVRVVDASPKLAVVAFTSLGKKSNLFCCNLAAINLG